MGLTTSYSKAENDIQFQNIKKLFGSGLHDTPLKISDPTPTQSGGYILADVGDYSFGNAPAGSYNVAFLSGTVWEIVKLEMPQATKSIPQFADLSFPVTNPLVGEKVQCVYNDMIVQLKNGKTATIANVPTGEEDDEFWTVLSSKSNGGGIIAPESIPIGDVDLDENKYYVGVLTADRAVNFNLPPGGKVEIYAEGFYNLSVNGIVKLPGEGMTLVLKNSGDKYILYTSDGDMTAFYWEPTTFYKIDGINQNVTFANNSDYLFPNGFTIICEAKMIGDGRLSIALNDGSNGGVWSGSIFTYAGSIVMEGYQKASGGMIYHKNSNIGVEGQTFLLFFVFTNTRVYGYIGNGVIAFSGDDGGAINQGTATRTPGTFTVGSRGDIQSSNCILRDMMVVNKAISTTEAQDFYTKRDMTVSFASNIVSFHKFKNNLSDEKTTHNGTAVNPQYT